MHSKYQHARMLGCSSRLDKVCTRVMHSKYQHARSTFSRLPCVLCQGLHTTWSHTLSRKWLRRPKLLRTGVWDARLQQHSKYHFTNGSAAAAQQMPISRMGPWSVPQPPYSTDLAPLEPEGRPLTGGNEVIGWKNGELLQHTRGRHETTWSSTYNEAPLGVTKEGMRFPLGCLHVATCVARMRLTWAAPRAQPDSSNLSQQAEARHWHISKGHALGCTELVLSQEAC